MFRALVDAVDDASWSRAEATDTLLGLALAWREMSAALDAFGQLVSDEAAPVGKDTDVDVDVVRDALLGLHEARARLEDALTNESSRAGLELHAAVLAAVKRLLVELDLDQRLRRQVRLARTTPRRVPRPPGRRRTQPVAPSEAETQVLGRISDDT
jgi:hypothetical protein